MSPDKFGRLINVTAVELDIVFTVSDENGICFEIRFPVGTPFNKAKDVINSMTPGD